MSTSNISVLDFGAVADWDGHTGTDNRTAFTSAISKAITAKLNVYVPPGKYLVRAPQRGPALAITENLKIFGDGRHLSLVKIGNASGDANILTQYIPSGIHGLPGVNIEVEALTIEAPNTLNGYGIETIFHAGAATENQTPSGSLNVKNCKVDGGIHNIKIDDDYVDLTIIDSELVNAENSCVLHADRGTNSSALFKALNSQFSIKEGMTGKFHCLYINNGVNIRIDNCDFLRAGRDYGYGLHCWGGGWVWVLDMMSATGDPDKQKHINEFKAKKDKHAVLIVDVDRKTPKVWTIAMFNDEGEFVFKELVDYGINALAIELNKKEKDKDRIIKLATSYLGLARGGTAESATECVISNTRFHPNVPQEAVCKAGATTYFNNCTFGGVEGVKIRGKGVKFTNCQWVGTGSACIKSLKDSATPMEAVNCRFERACSVSSFYRPFKGTADAVYRFSNCFLENKGSGTVIRQQDGNDTLRVILDGCTVSMEGTAHAIVFQNGELFCINSKFIGSGSRRVEVSPTDSNVLVLLEGNDFRGAPSSTGFHVVQLAAPGFRTTIRGRNNLWAIGPGQTGSGLQKPLGYLEPPKSTGKSIASASSLTLDPNVSYHEIRGTTNISTFVMLNGGQDFFYGPYHLIANGSFSFLDTANLKPKRPGAKVTSGDLHTWIRDAFTDIWYEI